MLLCYDNCTLAATGPGNDSFTYHLPDHPLISDGQFNVYNSSNKTNGSVSPSSEINKRAYEQAHGKFIGTFIVLGATTNISNTIF